MKLKSIEIKGFKSFYHRTKIEFPDGIVSIVGPNGSGKSNILDAFRWVLGEQSAKNLRGDKMEDVIFSGTKLHNQSNYCEVEVIFDNVDGMLDLEFSEISIKRKAYRSGESSYYINGKQSRLKEIRELFLDSGIGKEGYSVISQGKIDEIVNSTSTQRRKLLEEASGIARYRYKKEESEKKIDNSKVNLERLEDIFKEIEKQIEPLSNQREKALEYIRLKEELKKSDVSLMIKEYDELFQNHGEDIHVQNRISNDIDQIESELEANKEDIEKLEENNKKGQALIQNLEAEKNRLSLEKNNYYNEIQRHQERMDLKRELINKELVNQEKLKAHLEKVDSDFENLELTRKEIQEDFADKTRQEEKISSNLAIMGQKMTEFDQNIEKLAIKNRSLTEKISKSEMKIQFLKENIQREEIRQDESNSNIHRTREKLSELFVQEEDQKKALVELDSALLSLQTQKANLLNIRQEISQSKEQLKKTSEGKNQLLRDAYLKHTMYSNMQKDMEGINRSVKAILENKNLRGIVDIVSNIIFTEQKYEKSVETALGSALQHIITLDSGSTKEAIAYLKKTGSGRATFLPMDGIKSNLLNIQGVLRASDVVKYDPKYQKIVESLLGRTIIMDTMDEAILASRKFDYKYRIVTLDGEIFNPGGSVTGGHYYKSNNILGRKRKIQEYEQKMQSLQQEVDQLSSELEQVKVQESTIQSAMTEIDLKIEEKQKAIQSNKLYYGDTKNRINYLSNTLDSLLGENKGSAEQQQENRIIIDEIKKDLTGFEEDLIENKYILEDLQNERRTLMDEYEKKTEEKSGMKIQCIQIKNNLENVQNDLTRIIRLKEEYLLQLESSKEELFIMNDEIILSEKQVQSAMMNLQLSEIELDETLIEFEETQENLKKENKKFESVSNLKNELENKKMKLIEERYAIQGKIERANLVGEKILDRLKEDYEMDIQEARLFELEEDTSKEKVARLKRSIAELGNVNLDAIEDYNVLHERYETYLEQIGDLNASITELEGIIAKLEQDMAREFTDNFHTINKTFGDVFSKIFGGGEGKLVLSNASDVLNSDIEIFAQPPGKKLKTISVMSGGEKALMSIALLFAIQMTKPAPFCILDEIDAALDDANIGRFNVFLKQMADMIQFITITHRRGTMESSDYIYGVTMQDKGVSKLVSLKFEDAQDYIEQ